MEPVLTPTFVPGLERVSGRTIDGERGGGVEQSALHA